MSGPGVGAHPHAEPRTYPLMLRTGGYATWKPIVGSGVLVVGVLLIAPVVLLPVLAIAVWIQGGPFGSSFSDALSLKTVTPAAMLYLNLTLASAIVVVALVVRFVHRHRFRSLISVLPGVRWRFFAMCFGLAVVAMAAQLLVSLVIPDQGDLTGHPHHVTGTLVALALVVLVTTPLQAMGEEFAFRGYLMQAFGALSRSPVIAILVTSLLFALAHGVQNPPLFFDRFAFGLMAGYIVVRTGGLEAGIAMHIVNNIVAFGFALAFGDIATSLKVSSVSWWNLPLTVTQNGVFLILVLLLARRLGLDNRSRPRADVASVTSA